MTTSSAGMAMEDDHRKARLWRQVMPLALLSPAVLVTLAIVFFPMIQTAWMSLHEYVLFRPKKFDWVGLQNYFAIFQDEVFWISLRHTVIWIAITVPAQAALGLATALLLNQSFPWRPLARALIIIPWALPSVVIALMWAWIYDSNYGILNDLLLRIGLLAAVLFFLFRILGPVPQLAASLQDLGLVPGCLPCHQRLTRIQRTCTHQRLRQTTPQTAHHQLPSLSVQNWRSTCA